MRQLIDRGRLPQNLLGALVPRSSGNSLSQKRYFLNAWLFFSGLFPQRQEHLRGVFLVPADPVQAALLLNIQPAQVLQGSLKVFLPVFQE